MAVIRGDDVLDSYQLVIPRAAEYEEDYLNGVWHAGGEHSLPVEAQFMDAATGMIKAALGKTRKFLVHLPERKKLDIFRVLHYSVPVGGALNVGWYLTGRKRAFGTASSVTKLLSGGKAASTMASALSGVRIPVIHNLDLFDNADLHGLLAAIHSFTVLETIERLASKVEFDLTRINRQSTGMFGVS